MILCAIVDIDGCLADERHRLPLITGNEPDFKQYFDRCTEDNAHTYVVAIVRAMRANGLAIVLATGRPERYRTITERWLFRNEIEYDELFMRPNADAREDHISKREMLTEMRKKGWEPLFAIDDRPNVVAMWREQGIPCLAADPVGYETTGNTLFTKGEE